MSRVEQHLDRVPCFLVVLGTRPEAIKLAPVILALRQRSEFETVVLSTGQHRELLEHVLGLFGISSDVDLDIMRANQTPAMVAARILEVLPEILNSLRPVCLVVQGDTTTAMAAALAAHFQQIAVAHVEAGLRSGNREHPFPEESNRIIISHVADLHFAPTLAARGNLLDEGIAERAIQVTGNTVVDALQTIRAQRWKPNSGSALAQIPQTQRWILATAHRRESFGEGLEVICDALAALASRRDVQILFPVHPNPNVVEPVYRRLEAIEGISLLPPLRYEELVWLMNKATLIMTDSGGLQEEAPTFGCPVLVLREVTERVEAIQAGTAQLVGTTSVSRIVTAASILLDDASAYDEMAHAGNPFGDGEAAGRIAESLFRFAAASREKRAD